MVKETEIDNPITSEGQPDGGLVQIVDPYDGCQLACPYCFQLCDENWNREILVKTNIASRLDESLAGWDSGETIYIGSRCDPYMPLEGKYRLTRDCLAILQKHGVPVMIVTKAGEGLILNDLDILKHFGAKLTVLMGMSNIEEIGKGAESRCISTANELVRKGIAVWVFLTPVLPYIIDVDEIVAALQPTIPIYLDKLRIFKGSRQAERIRAFVSERYPQLIDKYNAIIDNGDEGYFKELSEQFSNHPRVKILF